LELDTSLYFSKKNFLLEVYRNGMRRKAGYLEKGRESDWAKKTRDRKPMSPSS